MILIALVFPMIHIQLNYKLKRLINMKITQIRNATIIIEYAGKKF